MQFPDPRNFFITATKGFFLGLLPSSSCPNQMTNNATGAAANTFDWQFSVSCTVSGACVRVLCVRAERSCVLASTHVRG